MRPQYAYYSLLGLCSVLAVGCGEKLTVPRAPASAKSDVPWTPAAANAPAVSPLAADPVNVVETETYAHVAENSFLSVNEQPLSTFSIDVDTASYANVRRFLQQRQWPPADAVRLEEMVNYFTYEYPAPDGNDPFAVHVEVAGCPWNGQHRLAKIGLQGRRLTERQRPAMNLVFLLDVSGSMNHPKKLPLVKESMRLLIDRLGENDHLAIVVYAGAAGLVLPSTSATQKPRILAALDSLQPGGSTNGALGIRLAYEMAAENFVKGGVNRVILCTDGDFNVGITNRDELTSLIEGKAKSGVFLSVLGYGMGNLKDATMELLADRGNGNYAYIDSLAEARKVLVDQMSGTLVTIAKDVKIQVEFNPAQVSGYRLVGYENRKLANRDFHDDTKDAGEIGAGHSVTALYEIVPAGVSLIAASRKEESVDALKYQPALAETKPSVEPAAVGANSDELLTVKLRFKPTEGETSRKLEFPVIDRGTSFARASTDFQFAAAVTQFGMLLKNSLHRGDATLDSVLELAGASMGPDVNGYRAEFVELVKLARGLRSDFASR